MADLITLRVNEEFNSYEELRLAVANFEKCHSVKLYNRSSRSIEAAMKRASKRSYNRELVYAEIDLCCIYGGKSFKSESKGIRPNSSRTAKLGCEFTVNVRTTKDGQKLFVKNISGEHNHAVDEVIDSMPSTSRSSWHDVQNFHEEVKKDHLVEHTIDPDQFELPVDGIRSVINCSLNEAEIDDDVEQLPLLGHAMETSASVITQKGIDTSAMRIDHSRVQALLKDTIMLLCQSSLHFSKELKVQGLLGVTIDDNSIFIVHINESLGVGNGESSFNCIGNSNLSTERFSDSATVGAKRSRCTDGTRKQRQLKSKKTKNHRMNFKRGQNNLNNEFQKNGEHFDVNCSVQNTIKKEAFGLDEMALKQDSQDVNLLNSHPTRQFLSHRAKQYRSNQIHERNLMLGLNQKTRQRSDNKIRSKTTLTTEIAEQQFLGDTQKFSAVFSENNGVSALDNLSKCDENRLIYNAVTDAQDNIDSSLLRDSEFTFDAAQPTVLSPVYGPRCKPKNKTAFQVSSKSNRWYNRSTNFWKLQKSLKRQQNSLASMKSFDICGHPGCGKQFPHKRHLLRHQTRKHRRIPGHVFSEKTSSVWPTCVENVQGNADGDHVEDFIDSCSNAEVE